MSIIFTNTRVKKDLNFCLLCTLMQLLLTGELQCLTLLVCNVRTMMTVLCINC